MPARPRLLAVLGAATLLAGACSGGGDGSDGDPAQAVEPSSAESTTESSTAEASGTGATPANDRAPAGSALFDAGVVHSISLEFDQAAYDAMIQTFADSGEKEWIEATATIDGTTYGKVGIRLKGNSSLAGLGGGFGGGPADGAGGDRPGGGGGFGGPSGSASADDPASLPWLIRLDHFVEGQAHDGYEDIVIRSNGSETSLNEAMALDLLEAAGLASQRAVSTSFTVNGGAAVLRLAIEHPDDDAWQEEHFEDEGALYKAESSGDWSYRGDDPAAYDDVFDQEGGSTVTDLTPLIDFLQFINESDDATFAADLPERLDVQGFATYLAMMEVVANFDDIDGPGNNSYLWYDVDTGQFTIVPWDMNLAFGGRGGRGGIGGGAAPGGGFPLPADGELPEGFEPPEGFDPADGQAPNGPGGRGPGGAFGRGNILVERFHANAEFEAMYQGQLTALRASLYASGEAEQILESWTDTLVAHATDLVAEDVIRQEAESIGQQFTA
jgi:spore coat protein CotH